MANTKDELLLRIRQHGKLSTAEQLRLTALLSVPAILAQLSSILMFYIDDAMVGSLGALASASIGIVATTTWLFWSIISCAATGFSVQVAHLVGANDLSGARAVFRQSLLASLALAVVTGLVGAAISGPLPHWLGGGDEICGDASTYFLIFTLGAPLSMINMLASSMLRCAGNIKVPSLANIVMCFLDVGFNFFLIFPTRTVGGFTIPGFGLGVAGAALGTLMAEAVIAAYLLWYAVARCPELRLLGESGSFRPQQQTLRKAGDIAGPIFLQRVLMNVAQITITIIVAPLGAVAIAANALGITAESLCYMPGYGIGEAATTLVGQSYGAQRFRLTERFAWMTTLLGIAVMTVMGVVMYAAAPLMMASLTPDEAVRQLGAECLRIEAWAEPGFAASIVAMSCFVGTGDTKKPSMMNLFSMWAVRVTLAAILAPRYGLHGVWLGMAIELTFRGVIFLVRMKWGKWHGSTSSPCTDTLEQNKLLTQAAQITTQTTTLSQMKLIKNQSFGGERPLFGLTDARLECVKITEGESGVKCCRNIEADHCRFIGKYPLWHVDGSVITNCFFEVGSRSAIWYSDNMVMRDCIIDAPKFFREMRNLVVENVQLNDADETFWRVDGLKVRNVVLHEGTYPFMFSSNIDVDGLKSDSKYVFQYVKNVEIHNADIVTKDAFWETENVTVYDSRLDGEYLGWHSKNLRLVRCHITGEQPLCYVDGLVLEDCTFGPDCDRMFEDTTLEATILGNVTNIKNPRSGHITVDSVGSVTMDGFIKAPADCVIVQRKEA